MAKKEKQKKYRFLKIATRIATVLLLFFIVLVLLVRSPWGQGIIVSKVLDRIAQRTDTKVTIDRLFLTFSGAISIEGLYLEDKKGDTLLYSQSLEASIGLFPLIRGTEFDLSSLDWTGLKANIERKESTGKFNFDFLIDAFTATDTTQGADTTAQSMKIKVGNINLNDFNLQYKDEVLGIRSKISLGQLGLKIDELNLDGMRFRAGNFNLSNSKIAYKQSKPFEPGPDSPSTGPLPYIAIDNFRMDEVTLQYQSLPDQQMAHIKLVDLKFELPEADLENKTLELGKLALHNSDFQFTASTKRKEDTTDTTNPEPITFSWLDWKIKVDELDLLKNRIEFRQGNIPDSVGVFNPSHLLFHDLTINARDLSLVNEAAKLQLNAFSFFERSGLQLHDLTLDLHINQKELSLNNLVLKTKNSGLNGKLQMNYPSLERLLNAPDKATVAVSIPKIYLSAKDAFIFRSSLAGNTYLQALSDKTINGNLEADGTLAEMTFQNTVLKWGKSTSLKVNGSIKNMTRTDLLAFNLDTILFKTDSTDIGKFISENDLGVRIPDTLDLQGNLVGNLNKMATKTQLITSEGTINLEGNIFNNETLSFEAQLQIDKLEIGKIFLNDKIGALSLTANASGKGSSFSSLDARLSSDIKSLSYDSYDLSNIKLEGKMKDGKGEANLTYKDDNLDLDSKLLMKLDSVSSKLALTLDMKGADLAALGLTRKAIKTKFNLRANFTGNKDNFDFDANIDDGVAIYDQNSVPYGGFNAHATVRKNLTQVQIESSILDLDLNSNVSPSILTQELKQHFSNYLSDTIQKSALKPSVAMNIDMALHNPPILKNVFLEGLDQMDSVRLKVKFDEAAPQLTASLKALHVQYKQNNLDSLRLHLSGNPENLNFDVGWEQLKTGPLSIPKVSLNGSLKDQKITMDFDTFSEGEKLAHVRSEIEMKGDSIVYRIVPDELILNKKSWSIPTSNQIIWSNKYLAVTDFELDRERQKFALSTSLNGVAQDHLAIIFENFNLATFTRFLNTEKVLAKGAINGQMVIENPFGDLGILAGLTLNDLDVLGIPLGQLTVKADTPKGKQYNVDLSLKGKTVDLGLQGSYVAAQAESSIDFIFLLDHLDIKALERLTENTISESEGSISGRVEISGTTANPKYSGSFNLNGASAVLKALNSKFTLPNEDIKLDNEGLYFNNFTIVDGDNDKFQLDGMVSTKDYTNPSFDLTLAAKHFQVVNSTQEDNDLFYGKINLDTDLAISGDLSIPKVQGTFKVNEGSDFTFVVPEDQVALTEKEGVVIFVNKDNPNDILTRDHDNETSASVLKGYDIDVALSVDGSSVFKVVIDERAGDNFQISGNGDFQLGIEPNGRTTLTGKYEVNDGYYEAGLYNLVKKKFNIAKGSTITWNGNPMDATLDIRAIYKVETSAAPLMADKTSGESAQNSEKFRQKLPFLVYLDVDGVLLKPEISFQLDMPEDKRGEMGGEVFGRVEQLNEQKDELNKQVFSLLALNQFFPATGSDGSSGGAASIARDNVNDVLSGQLNNFSNKLLGNTGLEVDFGLNSFTDYQGSSSENRTQLDINARKRLFNDRLIVQVGSEVDIEGSSPNTDDSTPMIGNVSLEYLLTENGKFRLKGFRENEYESVVDGQLVVTGIALIFSKEFNKFKELWAKEIKEEADKQNKKESMTEQKRNSDR
ncbi:translocation/assembly module TamB domain-containing protein [Flavobacteriaceae bacterium F89]|uniref:Translocation/assembly module TamB domain-containing protein n=1 Tax=Cerina litoralis TaxID=2874477 RepID=A0AAE3EV82_9FLAO|nr:translocation/assembly module TamB domain-containing protein [Cerina litoralis]MCG2460809.1 translocation/assembly module TamB domain-containing protein [Cerina litoralis]